jgi:hypothetical protein
MTVAGPATVTAGATNHVNLSWTGLLSGRKYLGTITYTSGPATIGTTVVRVDTP